jgi:hypothetical protein
VVTIVQKRGRSGCFKTARGRILELGNQVSDRTRVPNSFALAYKNRCEPTDLPMIIASIDRVFLSVALQMTVVDITAQMAALATSTKARTF